MIFIDFEAFKFNWMCVVADTNTEKMIEIVDDIEALRDLYEQHSKEIWIGHNIKAYDQYILKGLLSGFNPKVINDYIIIKKNPGYKYSSAFNNYPLIVYDTMVTPKSLKQLEGFMGSDIEETSVDFDIDRLLTPEEIKQTLHYCTHDVEQCMQVFLYQIDEFNASIGLINAFPEVLTFNDLALTKAQLSAKILECDYISKNDEFDISILPCINIKKYKNAIEFFTNPSNHWYKQGTKKNELKLIIGGLEHTLGWGGIHAGRLKYHYKGTNKQLWHIDVASFYPRLMIFHNLLTRTCKKPEKFKAIYEHRLKLKKEGKKKEQAPYKVVINGTYGICKDKHSKAYDPRQANLICVNGQLMLVDLIEHLEKIDGFELIQSNTDGLIIALPNTDEAFNDMDDICYEWEKRCNMELEFDEIKQIHQKDVNNYVFEFASGEFERKGAYVKSLSELDNDLPIVNKAIFDYMIYNIPVETTINNCDDMQRFQMIKKITNKFEHLKLGDEILSNKCVRVYANKYGNDGLYWKSVATGRYGKVTNSPEKCFIYNGNVTNVPVVNGLDKKWYIDLAKKRLNDYGAYDYV